MVPNGGVRLIITQAVVVTTPVRIGRHAVGLIAGLAEGAIDAGTTPLRQLPRSGLPKPGGNDRFTVILEL
jgi:hypothetical protein